MGTNFAEALFKDYNLFDTSLRMMKERGSKFGGNIS